MYLAPCVPHDPPLAPAEFVALYEASKLSLSKNFMPRHPFDNGDLAVRDELLAPHPRTPETMAGIWPTITPRSRISISRSGESSTISSAAGWHEIRSSSIQATRDWPSAGVTG